MAATLALFCGTTSILIERIFKNVRREGIIVACKAGKLKWPTVRLLLQAEFSRHILTEAELRDTKDAFLALSQDSAQRSMRFMQQTSIRNPSTVFRKRSSSATTRTTMSEP